MTKRRAQPDLASLTELDRAVLAVIARDGPMSAYDVRKVFAQSGTPMWSSTAGSIYPAVGRLETCGLVDASAPSGARAARQLSVNAAGMSEVRKWLSLLTDELASATPDPIRTRMLFMSLLDAEDRRRVIIEAAMATELAIANYERRCEELVQEGKTYLYYAGVGAVYELKGRLEWLIMLSHLPADALEKP